MGKKRKLKESASSTNNKETSEDSLFPQPLSPSLSEAESENKNDEREDETKKKKSTKKQIPRDENDPFFEVEILGIEREESEEEGEDLFDEKTLTKYYFFFFFFQLTKFQGIMKKILNKMFMMKQTLIPLIMNQYLQNRKEKQIKKLMSDTKKSKGKRVFI